MSTFLLVFFSVYTLMHAVVLVRLRALLPERGLAQILFYLFIASMIFAPVGVRLLEKAGHELLAQGLAYTGYSWLGFTFLTFWASLATLVIDIATRLTGILFKTNFPSLSAKVPSIVMLCLVLLVCVYGFVDARRIRVERVSLKTTKLPPGVDRLKIAQISDVHLGLIVREARLRSIIEKVTPENPDILVSTGDLVDGDVGGLDGVTGMLSDLHPRYGKYAITGNHEFYAGLPESIKITEDCGFRLLRGEAVTVGGILNIAGVDDPVTGGAENEVSLLSPLQNGLFTLFLKHRPAVQEECKGLFDLQLSGHSHKGQIFPFNFFTAMVYPMQDGLYKLQKGSMLFTSRGTGTWGPPMRVLSPPEVSIFELTRE